MLVSLYDKFKGNRLYLFSLLLAAFVLSGCQIPPSEQFNSNREESTTQLNLFDEQSLHKLQQESSSAGIDQQLLAARLLLQRGENVSASALLNQLPASLSAAQRQERHLIEAEIYHAQQQPVTALLSLGNIQTEQLSAEQQQRYQLLKDSIDKNITPWQIVRQLIGETPTLQGEERQNNLDQIWHYLTVLPESETDRADISLAEDILQGWLDLLRDYRSQRSDPQQWQMSLDMWRISHPNHPAFSQLPSQLLDPPGESLEHPPLRIALLLPFSGQASIFSQAIEQGFLAAAQKNGVVPASRATGEYAVSAETTAAKTPATSANSDTSIKVYDASQRPIAELLQEAERDGANFVVGPLLKQSVEQIAQIETPLKILALNEPERTTARDNICYFALAPEDEARNAASHLWSEGKRLPLVLIPAGELGMRMARAFAQAWQQQGSSPALVQIFPSANEMRSQIQQGIGLPLTGRELSPSQEPPQQLSQERPLAKINQHSEDAISPTGSTSSTQIDAIYIIATQAEMALLKPLMDMNNSRLRPTIHISSRSYQSPGSTSYRLELEGMEYSEIPLLAGAYPEALPAISQRFNNDYALVRLYAMGMDAWTLIHHFNQMQRGSGFQLSGYTGEIQSDTQCILKRKLSWLRFRQGQLQSVP